METLKVLTISPQNISGSIVIEIYITWVEPGVYKYLDAFTLSFQAKSTEYGVFSPKLRSQKRAVKIYCSKDFKTIINKEAFDEEIDEAKEFIIEHFESKEIEACSTKTSSKSKKSVVNAA